jgi:hypothetical protein
MKEEQIQTIVGILNNNYFKACINDLGNVGFTIEALDTYVMKNLDYTDIIKLEPVFQKVINTQEEFLVSHIKDYYKQEVTPKILEGVNERINEGRDSLSKNLGDMFLEFYVQ